MPANTPVLAVLAAAILYVTFRLFESAATIRRNRRLLTAHSTGHQYLTDTGRADIADNAEFAHLEVIMWSAALLVLIAATVLAATDTNPFLIHLSF